MKKISIKIISPEDEALILSILQAFQKNGNIEIEIAGDADIVPLEFDKNDEEILDLLDQADRQRGVPFEELRKRFGL